LIQLFRIVNDASSPKLTLRHLGAEPTESWIYGTALLESRTRDVIKVKADIDRLPQTHEFCQLAPGMLVLKEEDLESESGPNAMYYGLHWEMDRVYLDVAGVTFVCAIPKLTLPPDPASGAPCKTDGVYASVFRLEDRPPEEIYCSSGIKENGDGFISLYQDDGFSGLTFDRVWSSDGPPSAGSARPT
jgi:hypothetical protein